MKVLTFSRHFPKGHPKAGEPTYFVEKIEACLADTMPGWEMSKTFTLHEWEPYYNCTMPKGHTVRAGNRFKIGDMASLRVWSDKPYRSKQIEFAQVEVKKVWSIEISEFWFINDQILEHDMVTELAKNDGLACEDFVSWFNIHPKKQGETFTGQIISWSSEIEYSKPSLVTEKSTL
jgi:hypothetical protein